MKSKNKSIKKNQSNDVSKESRLLSKYEGKVKHDNFVNESSDRVFDKPDDEVLTIMVKDRYRDNTSKDFVTPSKKWKMNYDANTIDPITPAIEVDLSSSLSYKIIDKIESAEHLNKSAMTNSKKSNEDNENYVLSKEDIKENENYVLTK